MFAIVRKPIKGVWTPVVVEVETIGEKRKKARTGDEFVRIFAAGIKSEKYARPEWSAFADKAQAEAVLDEARAWYSEFDSRRQKSTCQQA